MPIRIAFLLSDFLLHAVAAASAPRPRPTVSTRYDRLVGNAIDRVCDLITPGGGWHFEDEVPDPAET